MDWLEEIWDQVNASETIEDDANLGLKVPRLLAALAIAEKSLGAICDISNSKVQYEDPELWLKINHLCADFLAYEPEGGANA